MGMASLPFNFGRRWFNSGGREGTCLLCIALSGSGFQKDRRGLERVLRVGHSTEASPRWGASPCAQVFLILPLLALEGRLHHPNLSSVASSSISNPCSLERQLFLLK